MLAKLMAVADIRWYLNGFHIEAADIGGVYLVATNGHAMLVIHDSQGFIEDVDPNVASIRASSGLVAAAKKASGRNPEQFVILDGKRLSIAMDFGMEHSSCESFIQSGSPLIESANYPNWKKVLPDFAKLEPGALIDGNNIDVGLLSKFNNSRQRGRSAIALWRSPAADSGVVVQCLEVPEAVGVVMPMRGSDKATELRAMQRKMPAKTA